MKPITCSDIEPTLIEYFSSADDVSLAQSNQQVPGLVLEHLANCSECAEIYQGFSSAISSPADSKQFEPRPLSIQSISQQVNDITQSLALCQHNPTEKVAADSVQPSVVDLSKWIQDFFAGSKFKLGYGLAAALAICVMTFTLMWPKSASFQQDIVAFQSGLDISPQTVEYVYQMRQNLAPKAWSGFASSKSNPFMLGAYYSEAIALFLQQNAGASRDHLLYILDRMKGHPELRNSSEYLRKLSLQLNDPAFTKSQALSAFANFSKVYLNEVKDSFSDGKVDEQSVMFEFGAWIVNLNLAALAKEENIKFEKDNLKYFNINVLPLSVPLSVVNTLDEIGRVLGKGNYNEQDYQQLFSLGMKLRTQLG